MGLTEDLTNYVRHMLCVEQWTSRDGREVPVSENLRLGNDAVKLEATVLYADISGSTQMVDNHPAHFAAEIYKAFLHCAAKLVREDSGEVTAYDGDRIMAVFIGDLKNTRAARTALKINHAVKNIINPQIASCYPQRSFALKHVVGIDTSPL